MACLDSSAKHDETGLIYMQARWMDPNSGTFLSIDPLVADAFDPQSMNAFAYARNNPTNAIDPLGSEWYFVDSYVTSDGTSVVTVHTNSAEGAGAMWVGPFDAAPTPAASSSAGPSFTTVGLASPMAGAPIGGGGGALGGNVDSASSSSSAMPGESESALTSELVGQFGLLAGFTGEIAEFFPSTDKFAPALKGIAKNVITPAAALVDGAKAVGQFRKGNGSEGVSKLADAAYGLVIGFGLSGPLGWSTGAAYYAVGGFDGMVSGVGVVSASIISAGPNGGSP